jgi:hypothetical protein
MSEEHTEPLLVEAEALASLGVVLKAVAFWDDTEASEMLVYCPWCGALNDHLPTCAVMRARSFLWWHQVVWGPRSS